MINQFFALGKFQRIAMYLIAASLIMACMLFNDTAQAQVVNSYQRIGTSAGNFNVILETQDDFGESIKSIGDLDGDGIIDLAVGTAGDDDGGPGRGAVYILFMNTDGTVRRSQKISNTQGGFTATLNDRDLFGLGVTGTGDVDGDGIPDIAVGASRADGTGIDQGAVWILFMRANGTVRANTRIGQGLSGFTGPLDDNDRFGSDLESLGDFDNDGVPDIAVSVDGDDDGGTDRGAFYILYLNSNGTVKRQQKISNTAGGFTGALSNDDQFGQSVALLGDVNGDGIPDLAAGAEGDDDGVRDAGAVWILFMNANGTVNSFRKISAITGGFTGQLDQDDEFGQAVSRVGDINGDGIPDLAVGAEFDDDGADKAGAAYILTLRRNGTASTTQKISATSGGFTPNPLRTNDEFGQAITALGDLNLDGVPDIAVTADAYNDPTRQNGTVFILFLNGSTGGATLNQQPILSPIGNRNVTEGNQLSISVSASDADGPAPLILNATGLPAGATFTDNGNGTGMFRWTPAVGSASGSPFRVSFRATDGLNATASEEVVITVTAAAANGNGSLTGTPSTVNGEVNLTQEGTSDWVHWSGINTLDRKTGVSTRIQNYTLIGNETPTGAGSSATYSWTNGIPNTAASVTTGTRVFQVGSGFEITVPADTRRRTLNMYVGVKNARGQLTATLSDGSAPAYTVLLNQEIGLSSKQVRLDYQAASAGQILTVRYVMETRFRTSLTGSQINIESATLTGDAVSNGALTASSALVTSPVNLTTEGSSDWTHWSGQNTLNRRDGLAAQITDFTIIGTEAPASAGASATYSWTNGTPTASNTVSNGTRVFEVGNGFQINVPADTTSRTLRFYVGAKNARGLLEATLSDGSAENVTTFINQSSGLGSHVVTINYQAAQNDRRLTVRYTMDTRFQSGLTNSQINIESATLSQ